MKQVQSYANTASGFESDIEAPRLPLIGHEQAIARHQIKRLHADGESKIAESCAHDYQDNWHCRKCGYVLTKHLRARIDRVTRYTTR
ncbi:MAG: hypothetical protein ACLPY5_11570 [Candidatus Bathyarchaeia archaeon]